ncbi:MAG: nuclear transport factor 2 family protein [Mycobacteriales bacterium]
MRATENTTGELAEQIHAALDAADLDAFAELLDPNVTWGAPGDPSPPCQCRAQVLAWYQQSRAEGRRGRVLDVVEHGDKILVTMIVTARGGSSGDREAPRWQVLTVTDGRISDIRGYAVESDALAAAGITS